MAPTRLPIYADNPKTPLNGLIRFMSNINMEEKGAIPERIAAVVFDVIIQRNERHLPARLSLGAETLKFVGDEIETASKGLNDWADVTIKVSPTSNKESVGKALAGLDSLVK